ncbi:MAG TPA: WXG100 family type VII secretion target [Amycolatopsis sp.]|nr:WXG100 family type VII secretion target [Amycolatopsis sp.]
MAGEHRTEPEAMRSVVGNVGGIITHGINTVADLERLILQPMSFAALGSAVATASAALHSGQVCAVRTLLRLLQEINGLIKTTADETGAGTTSTASIWGNSPGSELATLAINDSAGAAGEPSSVGNVLRYLDIARLCRHPITAARFTGVADFNDWLTADAGNQARIGLIEVYAGTARTFGDVPGGVLNGDVVVVKPASGCPAVIGIAGDGRLYNHGPVDPGLPGPVKVNVYRPAAV